MQAPLIRYQFCGGEGCRMYALFQLYFLSNDVLVYEKNK